MDAVVQLIRNALCCVKDLGYFKGTLPSLWDANLLRQYYDLDEPMNKTTPLDLMISASQFYATVSMCYSGWKLMHTSYGKLVRIQRIQENRSKGGDKSAHAERLIEASLVKEGMYATRSILIGFLVFCIGGAFFWLAAHSLHFTEAGWMGGIQGVIHSLTVAEIGLLPLLYYMWKDSVEQVRKSERIDDLANQIKQLKGGKLNLAEIDLPMFEALTNWLPFWDSGVSIFDMKAPEAAVEEKQVAEEKSKIQKSLDEFVGNKKDDDKKVDAAFLDDKAKDLVKASRVTRWEGYREFIFFLLNAIAFYSYMFCIITFYFDDTNMPYGVRTMMFNMDNESADWHGNFFGDLMWTIEPIVLLSSPTVFAYMQTPPTNVSNDDSKVKTE